MLMQAHVCAAKAGVDMLTRALAAVSVDGGWVLLGAAVYMASVVPEFERTTRPR